MNTRTTPPTTTTTTTPITGLHPRKHKAAATVSAAIAPEDASKQRRSSQRPHRRCCSWWWRCCGGGGSPRCLHSDVGHAVEAVIGFLLCGLCIGYFILHHHHRHIIVQIMKHPVLHGRAAFHHVVGRRNGGSTGSGGGLRGRYGFRHHFYSGPPRSVTVVLPSVVNPTGRVQRLQAIYETWGPGARAIYVVHQTTDFPPAVPHAVWSDEFHSTPHDRYSYPQLLQLPSSIEAENAGVHRLQYVIETVYTSINPGTYRTLCGVCSSAGVYDGSILGSLVFCSFLTSIVPSFVPFPFILCLSLSVSLYFYFAFPPLIDCFIFVFQILPSLSMIIRT